MLVVRRKNGIQHNADRAYFLSGEFAAAESQPFIRLAAPVDHSALCLQGFGHERLSAVTGEVVCHATANNGAAGNGWDGVCFHKGSFSLALARLLSFTAFSSVLASSQSNPPRLGLGLLE